MLGDIAGRPQLVVMGDNRVTLLGVPPRLRPLPLTAAVPAELCAAPPLTGPCRAAFHRWFYSPQHRQCRPFIYGGCRGNRNNYRDREECLQRCGGGTAWGHGGDAWGHWGE